MKFSVLSSQFSVNPRRLCAQPVCKGHGKRVSPEDWGQRTDN